MKLLYSSDDIRGIGLVRSALDDAGIAYRDAERDHTVSRSDLLSRGVDRRGQRVCESWGVAGMLLPSCHNIQSAWTCPSCGEKLEGQFGSCWKCGANRKCPTAGCCRDRLQPPAPFPGNLILVNLPQIRRQDVQFVAVFGDGAAGDGDALAASIFTTSWSDSGLAGFSLLKISAIMSFTLVLETSPPLAVCRPAVKKNFISNTPCGVCMYLPETARLTVVSCTPTTSATCAMVMGLRCATPFSMNSRWRCTISRAMFTMVCLPLLQALDEKFSGADFFADVIFHLGGIVRPADIRSL